LAAVVLGACHGGSHGLGPGDGLAADSPSADAYVPTESHALGMNDVSILLQLPEDPVGTTTFARMSGFPGGAELVPRDLFARLVTTPGDVGEVYDDFHLVAIRFDLCDRINPGPCPEGEDGRLRLVFQPLRPGASVPATQADDVALHAFYPIPAPELAPVVDELRALARLYAFQTESPIAINQALSATAPASEYASRLRALVERYAAAARVARLTLFAQDTLAPAGDWIFRGVEASSTGYDDIAIPTLSTTHQRSILVEWPMPPSFDTSPVADVPAGIQLAFQGAQFDGATSAQRTASLEALAAAQNPTMQGFATEQCANCHLAATLTQMRATEVGVDPATIAGTYTSSRAISTQFGPQSSGSLRAFGWIFQYPAISHRVANETALVLDEIDARFPPAPM